MNGGKNIIDESGKKPENIIDIEEAAAYEADPEFERMLKEGLDASWDAMDITVSEDLIQRTLKAVGEAGAGAAAAGATGSDARAAVSGGNAGTAGPEAAGKAGRAVNTTGKYNRKRFIRIASGIAAAAIIGVVGFGVIKATVSGGKEAADMNMNSSGSSYSMNSAASIDEAVTDDLPPQIVSEIAVQDAFDTGLLSPAEEEPAADTEKKPGQYTYDRTDYAGDPASGTDDEDGSQYQVSSTESFLPENGAEKTDTSGAGEAVVTSDADCEYYVRDPGVWDKIEGILADAGDAELYSGPSYLADPAPDGDDLLFRAFFQKDTAGYSYSYSIYPDRIYKSVSILYSSATNDSTTEVRQLENAQELARKALEVVEGADPAAVEKYEYVTE